MTTYGLIIKWSNGEVVRQVFILEPDAVLCYAQEHIKDKAKADPSVKVTDVEMITLEE